MYVFLVKTLDLDYNLNFAFYYEGLLVFGQLKKPDYQKSVIFTSIL
jgi:hypothetical protein